MFAFVTGMINRYQARRRSRNAGVEFAEVREFEPAVCCLDKKVLIFLYQFVFSLLW